MRTKLSKIATLYLLVAMLAMALGPATAMADPPVAHTVYDSIPVPLPPNMPSQPFQAGQTREYGDYVHLAGTNRALQTVTVAMSTWARHSDWPAMPAAGWEHPITLNIYNVVMGTPNTLGTLLATTTPNAAIPWRPEGDPTCPNTGYGAGFAWRAGNGNCYNGLAFNITFDLSSLNVTLPNNIVVGVAYSTQSYGLAPIGVDGPYNSLNVGTVGSRPVSVGADDSIDKLFFNSLTPAQYYDGGVGGTGTFREDTGAGIYGTVPMRITAGPSVGVSADKAVFCGAENATVKIDFAGLSNLFGYQLQVSYDDSLVDATGAWVNSFFDTADPAAKPWNATCAGGVCKFSVSHVLPQLAVNGSGTVAQLTLTPHNTAGTFNVTVSGDILSDRNANVLAHTAADPLALTVCGLASASGTVSLQGRPTPTDSGKVKLTNGAFGPYETDYNATTGAWSISNIKVMPGGGTSYTFDATHGLYLGNRMIHVLNPGDAYAAPDTKLKGGDANDDLTINSVDLSAIGTAFGSAPVGGAGTGADINYDGIVNILDLVLAGGNYGLSSPLVW
jgi:hypothetical protein